MSEQKTFRSAFNGFNREDVVHYIEYMNAKHTAEINQHLTEEEYLRKQLAQMQESPAEDAEALRELTQARERIAELEAQLAEATAAMDAAAAEKEAALAAAVKAEAERDEAKASQTTAQCRVEQELEAYRRAERMEREARERSARVYHQVNGVLADATVKVDDAAARIGTLTDQVMDQLKALQEAVSGSKVALQGAADTMYALRPTEDED